jgi:hypothetical protein
LPRFFADRANHFNEPHSKLFAVDSEVVALPGIRTPVSAREVADTGLLCRIDVVFNQSGSRVVGRSLKFDSSSRDQPEARYYCPEHGCKASFKRKYDIDRHFQKHAQSVNFFCPSEGCKYSEAPKFDRFSWDDTRKPLKSKLIEDDSDYGFASAPG